MMRILPLPTEKSRHVRTFRSQGWVRDDCPRIHPGSFYPRFSKDREIQRGKDKEVDLFRLKGTQKFFWTKRKKKKEKHKDSTVEEIEGQVLYIPGPINDETTRSPEFQRSTRRTKGWKSQKNTNKIYTVPKNRRESSSLSLFTQIR